MNGFSVYCYHGSPGVPEEFNQMRENLIQLNSDLKVKQLVRTGYPSIDLDSEASALVKFDPASVLVGYSFGAYDCLKDSLRVLREDPKKIKGIVLVSPYLYPEKKIGSFQKWIVKNPLFGDLILNRKGPKAIRNMLYESSFPRATPISYIQVERKLSHPRVLRAGILEKAEWSTSTLHSLLEEIQSFGVPVGLIWGKQDQTSSEERQIAPLREKLDILKETQIPNAGHAIPWTHPKDLAIFLNQFTQMSKEKVMERIGYHSGESKENNVFTFLEKNVEKNPNKIAIQWVSRPDLVQWLEGLKKGENSFRTPLPHQSITSSELLNRAKRVSSGYRKIGIEKGDRVILFVPMSVELYVAMFALQRIGAIPVFLDSWARRDQLGISAECVDPKAMISFEKAFALCAEVPQLANVPIKVSVGPTTAKYTASLEELHRTESEVEMEAVEKEHTALVTFTTGSSGTPKGANRTHRFLAAQHYALDLEIPYQDQDVDLPVFPIFSLNNLASGVSTVIPAFDVGVPGETDPDVLVAQILTTGASCSTLSPSHLNRLSAFCIEKQLKLENLRRVVTGGAPISRDNLVDFKSIAPKAETWVLYGSTEVEPMAHIEAEEMIQFKSRSQEDPEWVDEGVNVGRMVDGLQYRFLKVDKRPIQIESSKSWAALEVPPNEVGELIVAGEHVCRDYYNNSEAFSRAKIIDENQTVWHRTGDLARLDSEGYLWIVGRVHNAIQRGSSYEFPVRAEIILKKLPFVKLAAYLGMPDETLGEKAICVVTPRENADLKEDQKRFHFVSEIKRIMGKNGVPVDGIVLRESIPMDARHNSKVEYEVLRKEILEKKEEIYT